jgi:hypothetical protein
MSNQQWTPVRNGEIYCSPACGCNCTQAEFELATMQAERLCARMNNMKGGFKDWVPYVWENMGWHFQIRREVFQHPHAVHERNQCEMTSHGEEGQIKRYSCMVAINGRAFSTMADTPERALRITMNEIRAFMQAFENSFARFQAIP